MSKRTVGMFVIILTVLLSARIVLAQPTESHAANSMWIEPSSSDYSAEPIGYMFNVTIYANITSTTGSSNEIGGWQAYLQYNATVLNITGEWPAEGKTSGQSQFF
jgi:hypothetical protein